MDPDLKLRVSRLQSVHVRKQIEATAKITLKTQGTLLLHVAVARYFAITLIQPISERR